MGRAQQHSEFEQFARTQRVKRSPPPATASLREELIGFFKQSVEKRQTKIGVIGECWQKLVPEMFCEHCALESFSRGTLTVIVDSASHLYELKQLLLAGLQKQILCACKSTGLRKIALKRGQWYQGSEANRKLRFP
ncbi:MAG TPA: DciA family protein [Tepidisphaeraceae bacterium]|jgi:hypothetical protein